jgi:two-component system chemotaxis sensor kinase CheA
MTPPPKDPYRYFRVEARELQEQLGRGVLALEKGADAQGVARLLRLAHTLKGAARVVKQREIADRAHAIEEALTPWREAAQPLPREPIDAVLALVDDIGSRIAALGGGPEAAAPGAAEAPAAAAADLPWRGLRADGAEIDGLLDGLTQAHAQLASLRQDLGATHRARQLAELLGVRLAAPRRGADRAGDGPARGGDAAPQALLDELRGLLGRLERTLATSAEQMDRELQQVRDAAEQLRLVPASALFMPLERTARDAARQLGKDVAFEGRGGAARLDAEVLGAVQGALLQLVRNAVAHGIEPAAQRRAAGKPPEGRVVLDVQRQGRRVLFSCSDDGAGVDLEAVRQAAQRKGGLGPAAQQLGGQALLQLLLRGGLSTAPTVTEVSGRGIGLDVVRDTVERLGGDVSVRTAPGQGTTVLLDVPLSIASLEALEVEAAGAVWALPLDAVQRTLRYEETLIARTAQGDALVHEGQALPFITLARALGAAAGPAPAAAASRAARFGSAVIVQGAGARAAIAVDRLLGTASLVLRPLPELAPADAVVAGASLNAQGQPQIVLDPDGLVQAAQRAGAPPQAVQAPRVPVLVVDDSLTTRMLEQSILESAGYMVHAAVSAEDALERARRQRYALFLVDVEMPGMDGFTFVERTRADPTLREVPAILITSRSSPEDKRRGQEVGAAGYIVKSEFAQAEFLQRVHELVQ